MFTWLNKQGVQSNTGFIVQFTGRFTVEYRAAGKTITVEIEDGFNGGQPCIIISPDAFLHWDLENTPLSDDARTLIFQNFSEACEFQGLKVVVEK